MDAKNIFHTKLTYRIIRAEHLLILLVCSILVAINYKEVYWGRALFAFWIIDIIGYLPGALAFRKSEKGKVNRWYHHVYNIAHTYVVTGTGVAIWAWFGGWEWAMLAVPIHLSVDRGVFGNILKPVVLSFEPREHSDEEILHAVRPDRPKLPAGPGNREGEPRPAFDTDFLDEVLEHPSGHLALSKRNEHFTVEGIPGFISYRRQGKLMWLFGGVHAQKKHAGELFDRFNEFAKSKRCRIAAVQVRESQVNLFADRGFTVNQMGSTFATALRDYSFGGGTKMQLRNKIKRARRFGLRVVELGKDVPRNEDWIAKLQQISDEWIKAKGKKELDFMVGEVDFESDCDRRTFIVVNDDDKAFAFITYVPVYGNRRPGYLHDITRRINDAPPGTMELCNAEALERFRDEGVEYLHFGFTPFIVDEQPLQSATNRLVHKVVKSLRKHGQRIYPADSQAAYKKKWGADVIEREYLAARPISLGTIWNLMRLTRSV